MAPTSTVARPATSRPEITIPGTTTRVLVEQVGAVDVSRPGKEAGRVEVDAMWSIDESLTTVLGLD